MENVDQVVETPEQPEVSMEVLENMAAKQLLMELKLLKKQIYESGTLMNGVLIVQVKGILLALIKKYNTADLLMGEKVTLKLVGQGKHASLTFKYTPRLEAMVKKIVAEHMLPIPAAVVND